MSHLHGHVEEESQDLCFCRLVYDTAFGADYKHFKEIAPFFSDRYFAPTRVNDVLINGSTP
jgi:hypothetical protein